LSVAVDLNTYSGELFEEKCRLFVVILKVLPGCPF